VLVRISIAAVIALGACKDDKAPHPPQPANTPAVDARVNRDDPASITVRLARLTFATSAVEDTAMPPSPLGHGGQVRDVWVAPDGTELVTGYLYTGVPGPDTGVVWRRRPSESTFAIAYTTPEHELGRFAGRAADDVFVGGTNKLVHFDGRSWKDLDFPPGANDISAIAVKGDELWVASSAGLDTLFRRKLDEATWHTEPCPTERFDVLAFAGDDLYTGSGPTLYHRHPDGRWDTERSTTGAFYNGFYVASPTSIYATGGIMGGTPPVLLHSRNDGKWTDIAAPAKTIAGAIWGRSPTEIYLGTHDGAVMVWRDKTGFSPTALPVPGPSDWEIYLSGNADKVVVAYQHTPPRR